jgi:uncharacterized membrane protein YeaQ/YmgE (transglycosylase-associated protein family)
MLEPKDGDFVAYIDALQRESAARLALQHVDVAGVAFPTKKAQGDTFGDGTAPASGPAAGSVAGRFVRRDRDANFVKAIVAGVIGAVFLLTWLGDGGLFPFVVGFALLGYALPRLLSAVRGAGTRPSNRALIDQSFGQSGTPKTGSGK